MSINRTRRTLGAIAAGALTVAGIATAAPAAQAEPKQVPNGWADSWYTWTTGTDARDCSSVALADQADSALCGVGLAYAYPQRLTDTQPRTLEEFRAYVAQVQETLKPGERVTLQFDRYVGPKGQVKKVVKDGILEAGEDARIAREWHVVVLEGNTEQYVTWVTGTRSYDCSATEFADLAGSALCDKGLAHVYPQQLADGGPSSPADFRAYLEQVKSRLQPGQSVTVTMDRYVGTRAEIDAVLADGRLSNGEAGDIAKDWRVVVLHG